MFNCRLDRRYPLAQFLEDNNKEINVKNKSKITNNKITDDSEPQIAPMECEEASDWKTSFNYKWNTLNIEKIEIETENENENENENCGDFKNVNGHGHELFSPSQGSLVSQMSRLELEKQNFNSHLVVVEHSQQLILGLTYSMKNMLMKLGPVPVINSVNQSKPPPQQQVTSVTGYSFAFKTSKYRIHYFESFTGWKLVMITDCLQSTTTTTTVNYQGTNLSPESALKIFYSQVLLKYLVTYPLGTIYTSQKSSDKQRIFVENDFLHRAGFLGKMDEFIQNVDRIF